MPKVLVESVNLYNEPLLNMDRSLKSQGPLSFFEIWRDPSDLHSLRLLTAKLLEFKPSFRCIRLLLSLVHIVQELTVDTSFFNHLAQWWRARTPKRCGY